MIETYVSVIASLFIIEVLLSVDNALVNATLAESLPEKLRKRAIRIGILLGAGFRVVALLLAAVIIENIWLRVIGGLYLIYLTMSHLGKPEHENGKAIVAKPTYLGVITQIAFADLVFSIDNVISAVSFSDDIAIVILGVSIGIVSMLFITPILSRVIEKYKGMPTCAYAIVGFIGLSLVIETLTPIHITEPQKFIVVISMCLFTVWYEHSAHIRKLFTPALKQLQRFLALPITLFYKLRS